MLPTLWFLARFFVGWLWSWSWRLRRLTSSAPRELLESSQKVHFKSSRDATPNTCSSGSGRSVDQCAGSSKRLLFESSWDKNKNKKLPLLIDWQG